MTSVVVYPYIVPDFEWLKTAALLWDTVHRIGSGFSRGDPPELQDFQLRIPNLLQTRHVEDLAINPGSHVFRDPFETWLKIHYKDMVARGELSQSAEWTTVYPDKFVDSSVELLCKYRAIRDAQRPEVLDATPQNLIANAREYLVPKAIAVHYLAVIASVFGERERADLFSEETEPAETAISSRSATIGRVATTVLEAHLPENL